MYKKSRKVLSVLLSVLLACSVFAIGSAPAYAESASNTAVIDVSVDTPGTANSVTIDRATYSADTLPIRVTAAVNGHNGMSDTYFYISLSGSYLRLPDGTTIPKNNEGYWEVHRSVTWDETYNAPIPAVGSSATYSFYVYGKFVAYTCGCTRNVTITTICSHTGATVTQYDGENHWTHCNGCGADFSDTTEAHTFEYTPNDDGTHTVSCSGCDYTDAVDCSFGETWTDSGDGSNHEKACAVCGYVRKQAHEWEWKTDVEATCGAAGVRHQECIYCDAEQGADTEIPATGAHEFDWVIDEAATCGAAGVKHEKCANCDATRNEGTVIPATGEHEFEWVIDEAATCGAAGVKHEKCANCDATRNEGTVIPATGEHEFDWVIDEAA
ncbi:MAG: hypothetical protein IJK23_02740, partial [Clostridia bacterium]|nr:hypothetical protein [Clostridia bacterium]